MDLVESRSFVSKVFPSLVGEIDTKSKNKSVPLLASQSPSRVQVRINRDRAPGVRQEEGENGKGRSTPSILNICVELFVLFVQSVQSVHFCLCTFVCASITDCPATHLFFIACDALCDRRTLFPWPSLGCVSRLLNALFFFLVSVRGLRKVLQGFGVCWGCHLRVLGFCFGWKGRSGRMPFPLLAPGMRWWQAVNGVDGWGGKKTKEKEVRSRTKRKPKKIRKKSVTDNYNRGAKYFTSASAHKRIGEERPCASNPERTKDGQGTRAEKKEQTGATIPPGCQVVSYPEMNAIPDQGGRKRGTEGGREKDLTARTGKGSSTKHGPNCVLSWRAKESVARA